MLVLFAAGFTLANRFQLAHGVLYRAAANDLASAAQNFLWLARQAAALFGAIALVGRRVFAAAMVLAGASLLINLTFGQTLGDLPDQGKLAWLMTEARQGGNAAAEFAGPFALAGLQAAAAVALFVGARRALRKRGWAPGGRFASVAVLLLLPSPLQRAVPSRPPLRRRRAPGNRQLPSEGRTFTYAVLRGVHFQYRDHYPPGAIRADSPNWVHYETALAQIWMGYDPAEVQQATTTTSRRRRRITSSSTATLSRNAPAAPSASGQARRSPPLSLPRPAARRRRGRRDRRGRRWRCLPGRR